MQLKNIHVDPDKKEEPIIHGIGHITFSVANIEHAMTFYINVFAVQPVLVKPKTVYFEIAGIWLALNVQEDIPRQEIHQSYTHIAFSVKEEDLETLQARLQRAGATIEEGRQRNPEGEGQSIYFRDPDGHLLEFHTGTLEQRLDYYRK
nr:MULTISPECIES: metallothiol transferase FosB [unclassified Paenibacillus]